MHATDVFSKLLISHFTSLMVSLVLLSATETVQPSCSLNSQWCKDFRLQNWLKCFEMLTIWKCVGIMKARKRAKLNNFETGKEKRCRRTVVVPWFFCSVTAESGESLEWVTVNAAAPRLHFPHSQHQSDRLQRSTASALNTAPSSSCRSALGIALTSHHPL